MTDTIPLKTLKMHPEKPNWNASLARYRKRDDGRFAVVGMALAEVDEDGHILRCSALTCVWAGQVRFDGWLRRQVLPDALFVMRDGGKAYRKYAQYMEEMAA